MVQGSEIHLWRYVNFSQLQWLCLLTVVAVLSKVYFVVVSVLHTLAENIVDRPIMFEVFETTLQ
jgi:hypothetical protein